MTTLRGAAGRTRFAPLSTRSAGRPRRHGRIFSRLESALDGAVAASSGGWPSSVGIGGSIA